MSFHIEINVGDLRSILTSLSIVSDEGTLIFTDEGLNAKLVDPANVCLAELNIPAIDFICYNIDGDTSLAIAFWKTLNFISGSNKDEQVSLKLVNKKLEIGIGDLHYTQSLIAPSTIRASAKIPNLEFDATVEMVCKDLQMAIKSCAKVSDYLTFEILQKTFSIYGESTGDKAIVKIENPTSIIGDTAIAIYSVDYLTDIMKGIAQSHDITVEMSSDYPLRIEAMIYNTGTIVYILAPRITAD